MRIWSTKKKVAVIFGGTGHEHSVSVKSAEYFCALLRKSEYSAIPIYISKSGRWSVHSPQKSPSQIEAGASLGITTYPVRLGCRSGFTLPVGVLKVDVAIPLLHGDGGEDGVIQGALECAKIPYVGATAATSVLCHNKAYTKTFAEGLGIPTLPWLYAESGDGESDICAIICEAEKKLDYPMFIKPAVLGSSIGCAPVYSRADFAPAYRVAHKLSGGRVLIERMLDTPKELEVAYIRTKCNEIFTNPGEIFCKNGFYSYDEKYSENSSAQVHSHSSLAHSDTELVISYARALVSGLGIRHLCRIDFFEQGGKIYFNEINTVPGMTASSLYPRLIEAAGIPPRQMAAELIGASLSL